MDYSGIFASRELLANLCQAPVRADKGRASSAGRTESFSVDAWISHLLCLLCMRGITNIYEKNNCPFLRLGKLSNRSFPCGSDSKESACSVGDPCSISGLGRFPAEGNGYPLQNSRLENSMDRGAWQAIPWVCKESDTTERLSTAHLII